MILVQLGLAGLNVLSKLTMASGMSPYVLITYRNILGAVFLAPFAFFFERYDLISSINNFWFLDGYICYTLEHKTFCKSAFFLEGEESTFHKGSFFFSDDFLI